MLQEPLGRPHKNINHTCSQKCLPQTLLPQLPLSTPKCRVRRRGPKAAECPSGAGRALASGQPGEQQGSANSPAVARELITQPASTGPVSWNHNKPFKAAHTELTESIIFLTYGF